MQSCIRYEKNLKALDASDFDNVQSTKLTLVVNYKSIGNYLAPL